MITLYLVEKGILRQPVLYLSDYFERNRTAYYDGLNRVRVKGDLSQWFKFFLQGVIETAKSSIATFDAILALQKEVEHKLLRLGSRANKAKQVIHYLFQRPLIGYQKAMELTGMTASPTNRLLGELEDLGILTEITGAKRGKRYVFKQYLSLFE